MIVLAAIVVLGLITAGGAFAYAKTYDNRALPGTTIAGIDVGGMSRQEITAAVTKRAASVKVTVTSSEEQRQVSLKDAGITIDAAATANKAVDHGNGPLDVISARLGSSHTVAPVVTHDRKVTDAFASSLVPEGRKQPVDATVVFDQNSKQWTVQPGQPGQGIDTNAMTSDLTKNATALKNFTLTQKISEVQPRITDDAAQQALTRAQSIMEAPVTISSGKNTWDAPAQDRARWISMQANEQGGLDVVVDKGAVRSYVSSLASKVEVTPKNGIEQVDGNGTVVKVISEKVDGAKVSNLDTVVQGLTTAVTDAKPYKGALETTPVPAKVTQAKLPNPAEAGAQPAPAGPDKSQEKWIDIDLSRKTLTAYVGDTPVFGPRKIIDGLGSHGYGTVTGSFKIYLRYEKQDMTNGPRVPKNDPRYYYTEDVPYVQYFKGGYAIHGAYWRSSFGYSGSHGCINMSVADAKWMYNWASLGTRVEVHY